MAQTKSFKPLRALLLPAALLPWAPPMVAAGNDPREERVVSIVNNDEYPLEITDSKAMSRVVRRRRHSKDFGAPASPQPNRAPAGQRHWTLAPGMKVEFVVSDTSPLYGLEISNGKARVHCTILRGEPCVIGEEGVASLTPAGDHYNFAFEETKRPDQPLDADQEPRAEFVARVELDPIADQEVKVPARPALPWEAMPEGSYRFVPSVDRLGAGQKQALMDLAKPAPQPPARPARPRRADPVVPAAAAQALPAVVLAAPVPDADLQAPALPWAPESSITAAAWAEQVRVGKRENGWRKNPWQPSLAPVAAGQKVAPADLPEDFMPEAAPAPRGRRAPIGLHGATAAETGSLKSMREEARRKHLEEERRARMERRQKQEAERRASKAKPSAPAQPDQPVLMADVFAMYGEPEAATPSTLPQAEPSSHMADVFSMYGL